MPRHRPIRRKPADSHTRPRSVGKKSLRSKAHASAAVVKEILALTRAPEFKKYITRLLVDLCRFNTTPDPELTRMRTTEAGCFDVLERELRSLNHSGARLERRPINPAIKTHPNYSLLHFTKTPARTQGLSPEEVYHGRSNLLYIVPGGMGHIAGRSVGVNAHIDVVAPYFPPRVKGNIVFGRGACDDKGPVVGIVAAMKVLASAMAKTGLTWNRNVIAMFVVEEETGGNGSLSLATDRQLKGLYDSVLVSECTGLKLHPANRGAVWYRAELRPPPGVSAFEMFAFVNEEMEEEGVAIRAESRHALFPQRPVQTCHGIIGRYGVHPSRICGHVRFGIEFGKKPTTQAQQLVKDCLEAGLNSYIGLYGDKTKVIDPATGKPMVARHYKLRNTANGFTVDVYGAAGHMGSIRERDGAITKTAHLIRSLIASKAKIEQAGDHLVIELIESAKCNDADCLIMEGGQGFVPTHRIDEIMQRMRQAAVRGAENYLRHLGRPQTADGVVSVSYEKLHNVAFDGDPCSPSMLKAIEAARLVGLWKDEPVLGWTVSCDARLFATEYPGTPVLTFGPGQLVHAHSDHEQIDLDEIRAAAEFLALFLLLETGTLQSGH